MAIEQILALALTVFVLAIAGAHLWRLYRIKRAIEANYWYVPDNLAEAKRRLGIKD